MNKKNKIILGTVISLLIIGLGGWILFKTQLSWVPLESKLPFKSTWNKDDYTLSVSVYDAFDIVFSTKEPEAYLLNERIPMKDGVKIRNGIPYFNTSDASVFDEGIDKAFNAIQEKDKSESITLIVNGLYGKGTDEQNAKVNSLLGNENAKDKFELYFQWYNTIHELGHSITTNHGTYDSNNMKLRHMVDEEQLVNSFAIAFWMRYGEKEKLKDLETIVDYALSNIKPPVDNMSHIDFMRKAINEGRFSEVFNLETYGWFQFSIVKDMLQKRDTLDLESILEKMTGKEIVELKSQKPLVYKNLGTDMVPKILGDVILTLRNSDIEVLDVGIIFNTDPNEHKSVGSFPPSLLEPYIKEGKIILALK